MAIKYVLTMRTSSSPHLYLDQIKEIIKDDDYLLPQMRKALILLKKFKRSFIQLPLQMEVIISPEYSCNLERPLSPQLSGFNKTLWSEKDLEKYKNDKKSYLKDIKTLYNKMGYDIEEGILDDKIVKEVIDNVDKKLEKFGSKEGLLGKVK